MRTLILRDEVYDELLEVLSQTEAGRDLRDSFAARPKLPSDRELVAWSRTDDPPPAAVAQARAFRDAGRDAAVDTRETMEAMLKHCHAAGVRPIVLARWFGLMPTRVYEILAKT